MTTRPFPFAMAILLLTGAGALAADEPEALFESIYGPEARKVAASPSTTDDAEFAARLLQSAKVIPDSPRMQALLYEKACAFGVKDKAGYAAAEEALNLLARLAPARQAEVQDKLLEVYDLRFRHSTGAERSAAGEVLMDELVGLADGKLAGGDGAGAAELYRKAAYLAAAMKWPDAEEIAARLKTAHARENVARQIAALTRQLAARPDAQAARRLVLLHVVEADDPAGALPHAGVTGDETLKTCLPLAVKDLKGLSADECSRLGEWYRQLADGAGEAGRVNVLLRAKRYHERCLAGPDPSALPAVKARLALQSIAAALKTLRRTSPTAQWMLDRQAADLPPLPEDARAAVVKGAQYLLSRQLADGAWGGQPPEYAVGHTALATCALLQGGLPARSPAMEKALKWLAAKKTDKTYCLALRCNVWVLANRQLRGRYHRELAADVRLLAFSTADGSYGYDCRGDGRSKGCNSNSQFGLWGVYCGAGGRAEVPARYWPFILKHWLGSQRADGGWSYVPSSQTSATMTAAGLASMYACCDMVGTAPDAAAAIKKGVEWMEAKFIDVVENGQHHGGGDLPYFLYALARAGTVSGQERIGKIDWYQQGKKALLGKQQPDGSWKGRWGENAATSLALLFLTQGRQTGELVLTKSE